MKFAEIRDRIVNNLGFQTLEEVKRAGYRIVKERNRERFELDAVVFDVLDLTEAERLEVYRAVVQLVKERLVKAGSV
jgi:hypothetical protein